MTLKTSAQIVIVNPTSPWTVPAGVTSVKVEVWGGGGAGGGSQNTFLTNRFGGGGGGGGYSMSNLTVNGGETYTLTIGAGGTVPGSNANGNPGGTTTFSGPGGTVSATGGGGGIKSTAATGGSAGVGNTFNGGVGGTGTSNGGGGGGGAGNAAAGGSGANTGTASGGAGSPNVAPYKGGNGGAAQTSATNNGLPGSVPGGGGGGGKSNTSTSSGGAGAAGQVVLTYFLPTPAISGFGTTGGCVGTSITINGSFFNGATAANVTIGGTPVTAIVSNNGSQIVATIGNGTTGTVSVTTASGTGTSAGTFNVYSLPAVPSVTPPAATIAAGLTTNFDASGDPGSSFAWYSAATGGTLLANTSSYTPPVSCANATFYAEQISSDGCTGSRTATTLTRTPTPAPSVTPSSATVPAGLSTTFTASGTGSSFAWYSAATGGTLLSNTASFDPPASCTNTTFYAEQTQNGCASARTSATLTRTPTPAPSVTPPSSTVLAGQPATFTASGIGSSFAWYNAATGGTLLSNNAVFNTPGSCNNVTYYAEQTANGCAGARTGAGVTTTPLSAPTGTNGSICGLGVANISAAPATGGNTCNWYAAASGGSPLLANATNAGVTINASGSFTFYASTVNSTLGCESVARTAVTATSLPQLIAAPALSAASVCPGSNVTVANGASRSGKSIVSVNIPAALFSTTNAISPLTVSGFSSSLNNTTVKINYVKVNITHSNVTNLRVRLVAPDAGVFNLTNQTGTGANFTNTVFQTGGVALTSGTAPYTGTFAPQQAFSNFNGKNPNGTWTLRVENVGPIFSDAGTIVNWEINFIDANGLSYSWTSTPSGVNSTSSGITDNPSQNRTYNLVVNGPGGCTASGSAAVTMRPVPEPSASSNAPICNGFNLSLFGSNQASGQGTGNTWSWSGPSFSSSQQNPSINGATIGTGGTYTLTVTNSSGCTASTSASVTVNPNPVLSISTQTNVLCNGEANGTVDIDASNGTPLYLFDLNGNSTLDGVYSGLAAGSYPASVIDDNGCEASAFTVTITEPAVLSVNIGSNSPACTNTSLNLTATPVGGTAGYSYSWTGPGGFTSSAQNPSLSSITSGAAGQYNLQVTDAHGCIAFSNHTVSTIAAPTAVITNNAANNVCLTQPATFQLSFTGTGPWNYTVSDGSQTVNGTSVNNTASVNIIPTTVGTHNYTVTAVSDVNCAAGGTSSGVVSVDVITAPPSNTVGALNPAALEACSGTVMPITVNTVGGPNISYSWNCGTNSSVVLFSTDAGGPFSPAPFLTSTPSVYVQFGALGAHSGYNICVQGTNGCGSTNNKCVWIRGIVGVPGTITPATNVVACANDIKNYSCGLSGGATLYNWTLSGSALPITSGQGTPNVQVTFPPAFTSGQLCVTASLACGGSSISAPRCMTITNNPAVPSPITGSSKVCPGSTGVTYSISPVTGATGYNWTVPVGSTITSGAGTTSITVDFPNPYTGAPPVCVSALSQCGTSVARCRTVGTNLPGQPGSISGPTTNICNSTVQYSISNVAGASNYTWTNPAGTTIMSGQGSTTILLNIGSSFNTGQLTVIASTTACTPGNSTPRTISVAGKPNTPAIITANPGAWCNGESVNFSIASVSPIPTYNWTVPNGTISAGQGSNNIDVTWGNGAGNVNVNASNSCGVSGTRSQSFSSVCRESADFEQSNGVFTVYPNPAHDKITLNIDSRADGMYTVVLTDITGREMLMENLYAKDGMNSYTLNLEHFAKGVYMLAVQFEGQVKKTKVIIE